MDELIEFNLKVIEDDVKLLDTIYVGDPAYVSLLESLNIMFYMTIELIDIRYQPIAA